MHRHHRVLLVVVAGLTALSVGPAAAHPPGAWGGMPADSMPWVLHEWIPQGPPLDLMLVHPDGTGLRPLMEHSPVPDADNQHADWSPDGRQVAFEALHPDGAASVWTVDADGTGARERVTCVGPPCLQIAYPAWSPDGRSLLVIRYDVADNGDWGDNWLEVVNLRTGARRAIARIPGDQAFYAPRWSPDGRSVVVEIDYYQDTTQSELTGSVVAVVGATGDQLHRPRPITEPDMFAANPDWHPTRQLIVFGTNDLVVFRESTRASNVYTVRPDGRGLRKVTGSTDGSLRFGQPTFTPDGRRISLVVGRADSTSRLTSWRPALVGVTGGCPVEIGVDGFRPRVQPRSS